MKGKIFNAQKIQAMKVGNAVMFREVIKVQPNDQQKHIHKTTFSQNKEEIGNVFLSNHNFADFLSRKVAEERIKCPYKVGQKIFVKEVFCKSIFGRAIYKDEEKEIRGLGHKEISAKWKPAQHMKQEHSRLTLEIADIRVERLKEISEENVIKEGVFKSKPDNHWHAPVRISKDKYQYFTFLSAPEAFAEYWNATHKKPEEKFEASPFVWVVSFSVINN